MSRFMSRSDAVRTSPSQDDFATADTFTHDQLIHSTLNFDHSCTPQPIPLDHDDHPDPDAPDTAGSAEMSMSIELGRGRGAKRGAPDQDGDSSHTPVAWGGDSQYDVAGTTQPTRPKTLSRKSDGLLRREASVRAANSAVKSKHRSISEAIGRPLPEEEGTMQPTVTARSTRFAGPRRPSAPDGTPRRAPANNPTVQSATNTANSFALPDMAGITELVSGVRADGTPIVRRTKPVRSRFTSANYQPARQAHAPIDSLPIPQDEHKIYTSLQTVKEQLAQYEANAVEAERREDDYEQQMIELRRQLEVEKRRQDRAPNADEGTASVSFQQQKSSLQASVNALEQHCHRAERKASTAQINLQRMRKERDELLETLAAATVHRGELETENQDFREGCARLVEENEILREQLEELRAQLDAKSFQPQQRLPRRRTTETETAAVRTARSGEMTNETREQQACVSEPTEDLSTRLARAMEKYRQAARDQRNTERPAREIVRERTVSRSRSKSQPRQQGARQRLSSAPVEDIETTTEMEITQKTRNALDTMRMANQARKTQQNQAEAKDEDNRDITLLSLQDPSEVANLRKKLEEEHMARKNRRNFSAPEPAQREDTVRPAHRDVTRKSSLRDITTGLEHVTGRLSLHGDATEAAKKTVRVQSPQQTEDGDVSTMSNISRRRRRAVSEEGMTSAFILPDINFSGQQLPDFNAKSCIAHVSATCTACHPDDGKIEVPTPVPVTDRPTPEDPDVTTATVRPAQAPPLALASVLKQLEDEVTHLKLRLAEHQRRYHQHDPALSKRQRLITKSRMDNLTKQIETRSEQIYALYDVLEGQKQAATEEGAEQTSPTPGFDPAALAGRVGRTMASAPLGWDEAGDESSGDELPGWEGLSDDGE